MATSFVSTMCSRWFNLPQFLKRKTKINILTNKGRKKGGRLGQREGLIEGGDVREGGITKGREEENLNTSSRRIPS